MRIATLTDWKSLKYVRERQLNNVPNALGLFNDVSDLLEDMNAKRVDLLAFAKDADELVIVDLKCPGHTVELDEVQWLEQYQVQLMRSRPKFRRVLVYGRTANVPSRKWEEMKSASNFEETESSDRFAENRKRGVGESDA